MRPLDRDILMSFAGPVFAAVVIALSGSATSANDTVIRVVPEGIEYVKNENIRILDEVLEISRTSVRVKYRFRNESDEDIHTTVGFPLPAYDCSSPNEWPHQYEMLEQSFRVRIDGNAVRPKKVRKATSTGDRDITAMLREVGFSDQQIFDECYQAKQVFRRNLTKLQKEAVKKLRQESDEQIAKNLTEPEREAMQKQSGESDLDLMPWYIEVAFHWEQNFPAGKEIIVEHEYVPANGGAYTNYDAKSISSAMDFISKRSGSEACLDDRTRRALEHRIKSSISETSPRGYVTCTDLEYVLGTGRNWKGPIGEFTLRVEKDSPKDIVSLCFPGEPKKISQTIYEFHHKDFVPQDKIVVYFYDAGPEEVMQQSPAIKYQ